MENTSPDSGTPGVAFALGGGGELGGHQLGMLRALLERDIVPEFIVGTSIGSIQGAMLAANPHLSVCDTMVDMWRDFVARRVMKLSLRHLLSNAAHLRASLAGDDARLHLLIDHLGAKTRIEDLAVPFQACAASIERATARYFDSGPVVPALMASSAVPGLWPPYRIKDEHYIDGGVVETVPVGRAVAYGAKTIYVLRLRQREEPLHASRFPWQLGKTVYEVSRRYHLGQVLNNRPDGVTMHILPSGEESMEPEQRWAGPAEQFAYLMRRADLGYRAACEYLDAVEANRPVPWSMSATSVGRARAGSGARSAASLSDKQVRVSPYVAGKLEQHFQVYDLDGDGQITADEFRAAAARIPAAFGLAADDDRATTLTEAYEAWWNHLCEAAGTDPSHSLTPVPFGTALARLTSDRDTYEATVLPVVAAILAVADDDHDHIVHPAEIRLLLPALGVAPDDVGMVTRRLDTNGDGVITLDELSEAFHDYFTSDEPGCVGNLLFGTFADQAPAHAGT